MAWSTSNRASRLPPNWRSQVVPRILRRDSYRCQLRYEGKCQTHASEVDHIRPGDDHRDVNLQAACKRCHGVKSAREGRQTQLRRRALRKRTAERHPNRNDYTN